MVTMDTIVSECRYLLRFDDICPTMNWAVWDAIEAQLVHHSLCPILAVVPDNRDSNLIVNPPCANFWEKVRRWQSMGYAIALHGYQHRYVNKNAGLMRLISKSEFAGLPRKEQETKLRRGLGIFTNHGIQVDAWVAPSHSFDKTTVTILAELGVSIISDGLWRWPFTEANGTTWVPQQLWEFRPKPQGLWTVCYHHNKWTDWHLEEFGRDLIFFAPAIIDLHTAVHDYSGRKLTTVDRWVAMWDWTWNHYLIPKRIFARRIINYINSKTQLTKRW
ncbi:MAG: DUF2334 domain-containing protein [Desulfobulbaceae bacterium]|jgi:predicted deacetylase|nr:DUF2334 domain-containing protein [Desulfobulbaceae bacterium]